uniref:BTB domain-containing protein n=1 Tax=Timema monikensis TaxID=170555 RepID=A0A7R9E5W8_9NEOP|nr:unnamed protein product [Timema monikensis]
MTFENLVLRGDSCLFGAVALLVEEERQKREGGMGDATHREGGTRDAIMQHCVDSPQQFCLRWNNYQSNLTNVFDQLLQSESFVDVTLACDGHSVKAHKMVLSACSPYFQSLFFDNPCQHPIVILKDIKWPELKAAVEFMYKGEINVSQEQIGPLLKVAESLKIRGLADVNGEPEFGGSGDGGKKTSSATGWDSRHHGTPAPHDLSESAASPSPSQLAAHRQKKRRRTSGERSSVSSPEENSLVGVDGMETSSGVLELSPHPPPPPGPGLAPPPSSHNMITDTLPLPPPPPPSSHPDDMEIKPGIAEMIREEERHLPRETGSTRTKLASDSHGPPLRQSEKT